MTLDNLISSALKVPLSMRLQHIDKHAGRMPRVTGGLQIKLHAHFKLSMGGHRELEHVMDDDASKSDEIHGLSPLALWKMFS